MSHHSKKYLEHLSRRTKYADGRPRLYIRGWTVEEIESVEHRIWKLQGIE